MNVMTAYEGDKPFIFISYAHKDKELVWPVIDHMMKDGYRVWYDDGIHPGTEWDEFIATKISICEYFVAFISDNYINSDNCKDELNYARDNVENKLLIYLQEVSLPKGMEMRLGRIQAIHKSNLRNENVFYNKLYSSKNMNLFKEEKGVPAPVPALAAAVPPIANQIITQDDIISESDTSAEPAKDGSFTLPSTWWGRWGIPGFRRKKIFHILLGLVSLIVFGFIEFMLIVEGYSYAIANRLSVRAKAFNFFSLATLILLMALFNGNYGWIKQRVFKLHRLPKATRWIFNIAVNILLIVVWFVVLIIYTANN